MEQVVGLARFEPLQPPPYDGIKLREGLVGFSAREKELLLLLARGISTNKEIAREMEISDSSIKAYVSNVMNKMGVSARSEVVAMLYFNRLVVADDSLQNSNGHA